MRSYDATPISPVKSRPRAFIAVPPVCDFYCTPHRLSSLGAKIVYQLLCELGFDVTLCNFPLLQKNGRSIDLPQSISYLRTYINPQETGKLSYYRKYQRFGPRTDECAQIIVSAHPDICFISCISFSYAGQTLELAEQLKKMQPELPIAIGGSGPSAHPFYFIRESSIDFVLVNEAEMSIKPFIQAYFDHAIRFEDVPNLFWKKNNHIQAPLSILLTKPHDISVIISKTYETGKSLYLATSLSRGCLKKCSFCSNHIVHGSAFRTASIDTIKQAISSFPEDDPPDGKKLFINFEDDNLLLDKEYFFTVIRIFRDRFPQASFLFENGIDYTLMSAELAQQLVQKGLSQFNLSIGSTDRVIMQQEKRPLAVDRYVQIVRSLAAHGIPCTTYFICGFKNDSKESVADTLAFLFSQPTFIGISLFYAVPGIADFKQLHFFDAIPPCVCNGSSAYPWNSSLSTETLITAFRLSRYCNLVKQQKKSDAESAALRTIQETKKLFTFMKKRTGTEIIPVQRYDEELTEMFFSKVSLREINPDHCV